MSGVLERIVADVRAALEAARTRVPAALLEDQATALQGRLPPSFAAALRAGRGPRVIAEVKKRSPSKGAIAPDARAGVVAAAYARAGAAAVSVLTEARSFGGSLDDLRDAAGAVPRIPLLRKDFIFDRYQLLEARTAGASAVLLMVSVLGPDPRPLRHLLEHAWSLDLEALVEVHDERELGVAIEAGARVIGVNSRDLRTLEVDLATHVRLAPLLPRDAVRVAESGIRSRQDMERLAGLGYDACLVGERLMSENDPGAALAALLGTTG